MIKYQVNWIGLYSLVRREVHRTVFRVGIQTLVAPWITALLYIFIFGKVVGSRIDLIAGVPYIQFVLPGILMMNVLMGAFSASSNAVYMKRFLHDIEELLVAPFSYIEMIIGFVSSAVTRAIIIALGIYVIAIFFGGASIANFWLFLFYIISVSIIFSLLGLIVGMWADGFEQLNIWNTFVITPLAFLGGVFYSIEMLPEGGQVVALWNPFFYFIDGVRYSMIGISEAHTGIGMALILFLIFGLTALVGHLFRIGWRIRE